MRSFFQVLLITSLVLLAACSRGPDDHALKVEIQQRLDQQFSDKLFELVTLKRKGSSPRLDGVDGIYVYYNLELKFLRDYNLISWRGLNVGTLAAVLGASTTGIEGFNNKGNKKGDRLMVRGRISYQQLEKNWVATQLPPAASGINTSVAETLDTTSPDAIIKSIRYLLDHDTVRDRSEHDRVTLRELHRSLARIDLGHAGLDGYYIFGTGWPKGSYYKFGKAFSDYANKNGFKVFNYASEGSLENGYSLNIGRIDFALLQSDAAEVLYRGWIEEGQLPNPDLRAIASLWPEAIHIITFEGNGIDTINDLQGKKIAMGSFHSGTRFTAARIGLAAGLERFKNSDVKMLGRGDSIAALEKGEVDVVFLVGAIPDPAIQDLAQRRSDIKFISLDQSIITRLTEQNFAYYGKSISAKTYPGQTESILTLGVAALLMTSALTPDDAVSQFMKMMIAGGEEISLSFYQAGFISYKTARLGISMPLHPAAERYYTQYLKQQVGGSGSDTESKKDEEVVE